MLYTFSHFKNDFTKVSLWNITQRIIHSVRSNSDSVAFEFLDKSSHLLRQIATVSSSNNRVNVQEYEHLPSWKNWEATFWKDKCYLQAQGRERRQRTNWKKGEASKYGKRWKMQPAKSDLACEYSRFFLLLAAMDVSNSEEQGETAVFAG